MEKLEKYLGGIKDMPKMPGALFVVDPKKKKSLLQKLKIGYSSCLQQLTLTVTQMK